jgi:hypothetical protein
MDADSENRWAVYPIEKIEAAVRELSEAIVIARQAHAYAQARAVSDERELDKLICPGCHDGLYREGQIAYHVWADGGSTEPCLATPERKKALREYFYKDIQLGRAL